MFSPDKFLKSKLEPRTDEVEVTALSAWFDKDEKPLWKVRGLSGEEMTKATEAATKQKNLMAVVDALSSNVRKDKVDALKDLLGTNDSTPVELAKRMEQLVYGSIEPEADLQLAVKLAEHFPVEFMLITNKIIELTGLGSVDVGKSVPSTKKQK